MGTSTELTLPLGSQVSPYQTPNRAVTMKGMPEKLRDYSREGCKDWDEEGVFQDMGGVAKIPGPKKGPASPPLPEPGGDASKLQVGVLLPAATL